MKRLFVIAGLVTVVIGICFLQRMYLNHCYADMMQALNDLEKTCQAEDFNRAAEQIKSMEKQWIVYEKKLSYFLDNADVAELGTALGGISKLATGQSKEDLLSQISMIRVQFVHMKTANEITWDSVF